MTAVTAVAPQQQPPSILAKFANRFSVDPNKMLGTLKATCFKGDVSNEQMIALLIVADQYQLNPFTREIFAFPDKGGIVPVVGVDGWTRIINSHPQFDGLEFREADTEAGAVPAWIECVMYRKDRSHPIAVREYFAETRRDTGPWKSHPRRLLRHKALIQAARLAFGFTGIYDQDEAERIVERDVTPAADLELSGTARLKAAIKRTAAPPAETIDADTGEVTQASASGPAVTYAELAGRINKAAGPDDVDVALDLVPAIADAVQQAELYKLGAERKTELAK